MIDFSCNHFELLGVPERFDVDAAALERGYRALQSEIHPDRFAAGAAAERRLALQSSARVNEAYQALKDPVDRAHYLLTLHGVDPMAATGAALPVEFLERQLERREAAAAAFAAGEADALEALLAEVRAERASAIGALATLLDRDGAWDAARAPVRELTFLGKLAADLDEMLGELES